MDSGQTCEREAVLSEKFLPYQLLAKNTSNLSGVRFCKSRMRKDVKERNSQPPVSGWARSQISGVVTLSNCPLTSWGVREDVFGMAFFLLKAGGSRHALS